MLRGYAGDKGTFDSGSEVLVIHSEVAVVP
jgi:hypothetical protein